MSCRSHYDDLLGPVYAWSTGGIESALQRGGAELKPIAAGTSSASMRRCGQLNLSARVDSTARPGSLRHPGWEDPHAHTFTSQTDVNGTVWENFSAQQASEINVKWPGTSYMVCPSV